MKKITKQIDVYVSSDGVEHLTEDACKQYEKEHVDRYKNFSYFGVTHSPDLTEGRGYHGRTYVVLESDKSYCDESLVREYCYCTFGPHIAFVQGCSPTPNWLIDKLLSLPDVPSCYAQVGDTKTPAKMIFLSKGKPFKNWPLPYWPSYFDGK